jgi:hypothetical protein
MLLSWRPWHTSRKGSPRRPYLRSRRSPTLWLEQLEDRTLLSTTSANFVEGLYETLLHRHAGSGEMQAWVSVIDAGASNVQVVQDIETSVEYRSQLVESLYMSLLHRPSDTQGLQGWVAFLAQGGTVEQLKANFLGSGEYFAKAGGTDEAFLAALYGDVLGRAISPGEQSGIAQVMTQGASPLAIATGVVTSPEGRSREVNQFYVEFLDRTADSAGLAGWVAALQSGATPEDIIAAIAGSPEGTAALANPNRSAPPNPTPNPTPPSITFLTAAGFTTNTNVSISGRVAAADAGVGALQAAVDGGGFAAVALDAAGNFSFATALPLDGTADGPHTITFRAADAAGDASADQAFAFTLHSTLAGPPAPTLLPASDSGRSHTDNITNVVAPTVVVATHPGDGVQLLVDGVEAQQAAAAGASTPFTLAPLADGKHTVVDEITAADGSSILASAPLTVTIVTKPPLTPTFGLSPADTSGGSNQTDAGRVTLVGQTDPNVDLSLTGTGITALSASDGTFQLPNVTLAAGANTLTLLATDVAGNTSTATTALTRTASTGAPPDAVITWNQATLNAIQQDGSDPVVASRGLAMVQAAVYDAVNAVAHTPAYYVKIAAPAGAAAAAAVDAAAHDVLLYLYPAQQATLDALLATQTGCCPPVKRRRTARRSARRPATPSSPCGPTTARTTSSISPRVRRRAIGSRPRRPTPRHWTRSGPA